MSPPRERSGRLRIVAGELGGRLIRVPHSPATRPTTDRVREALFDILGRSIAEARVLDAFCGSGALGIEALSRGARSVVFVESGRSVIEVLCRNLSELGLGNQARVVQADAVAAVRDGLVLGPFDLILADPPYDRGLSEEFLEGLAQGSFLEGVGTLVLERSSREPVAASPGGRLGFRRSARYGDTRLDFYGAEPAPGSMAPGA